MKIRTLVAASACFIMITGFIAAVPGYAEVGFGDWVGLWFKGTIKDKGLIGDESGINKAIDKTPTYGYVENWDGTSVFRAYLVQFDDESGLWIGPIPYTVKVISGTPLNYVSYGFIAPEYGVEGIELFALILNIKGKEKNGAITKVKATTVGGCVIYDLGGGAYFSASESLTMKGVPAGKVPVEVITVMAPILPP